MEGDHSRIETSGSSDGGWSGQSGAGLCSEMDVQGLVVMLDHCTGCMRHSGAMKMNGRQMGGRVKRRVAVDEEVRENFRERIPEGIRVLVPSNCQSVNNDNLVARVQQTFG